MWNFAFNFDPEPFRWKMSSLSIPKHGARSGYRVFMLVGIGVTLALVLVLIPAITAAVALLVLGAQLGLWYICNAQMFQDELKARAPFSTPSDRPKPMFLSVHVPAHNEPPHILIATLRSLQNQTDAPNHEILVIVNNTADDTLWRPVEAWCAAAAGPFRFFHCTGVAGAKAGALNIAITKAHADTTHVVVIDADYQVVPEFLRCVSDQITMTGADFIQFPQAYRHLTPATEGLSFELADYFNRHARAANMAQAMLLTGTLSVISLAALRAVGGWPCQSGTEDAALGSNLIAAGYAGVFIDQIVGRGLMPLDLASLHQQRLRWAAGNAQVLLTTACRWAKRDAPQSTRLHKVLVASQLAAWLNFGALAAATLMAALAQLALGLATSGDFAPQAAIAFSLATVMLIFCGAIYPLVRAERAQAHRSVRWQALLFRVGMLPVSALATLSGLLPRRQVFHVTPKEVGAAAGVSRNTTLKVLGIGALAIIAAGMAVQNNLAQIAGLFLLLPLMCALFSRRALAAYATAVAFHEES